MAESSVHGAESRDNCEWLDLQLRHPCKPTTVRKNRADTTHSTSLDLAGKVGNRNESDNKEGHYKMR